MVNRSSIIRFLFILVLTTSCACKNPEGQETSAHPPQKAKRVESNEPRLQSPGEKSKNYVPGEILIKFRDGTKENAIQAIMGDLHPEAIRVVSKPDLYLMKILDGSSVESVLKRAGKYEEVQYSEPNYVRTSK